DVLKGQGDRTPIETALSVGSTPWGIAVWAITVRGAVVPGRWIVLGREFVPHLPAGPPADAPEGDPTGQLERPRCGGGAPDHALLHQRRPAVRADPLPPPDPRPRRPGVPRQPRPDRHGAAGESG